MNEKDKKILNVLIENSRISFREIAKKTNISVVTLINHVKMMEKEGIIKGYTINLDYDKLGYDVPALIHLQIAKGKLFEVEEKIGRHPNVTAVYDTTGNFDAVVIARFKSRRSLDAFLKKIQSYDFIVKTKTKLILNNMKEENIRIM